MALVGRSSRRHGARWWLVVGIVATLVVLLVDASIKSRDPGPVRAGAGQAWVDRALPIIGQSSAQGAVIARVFTSGLSMTAAAITAEMDQVVAGARGALAAARALHPPADLAIADGALVVCLQTRADGAATLAGALGQALSGPAGPVAAAQAPAIQTAAAQFQVADQAYRLLVADMPRLGVKLPASVWYSDPPAMAQPALSVFLQSLRAATNDVAFHDVAVEAVTTTPPAVGANGSVEVLPPATLVAVQTTVSDLGNQPENGLAVTASVSPGVPGYLTGVRQLVSLVPGRSMTLSLGSLRVPSGVPVTLTVTAGPAPGQADVSDTTKVLKFQMP
ncbi:MAG: hypothetical protein ACRDY0_00500 [Acidimicrobiales bacterium]